MRGCITAAVNGETRQQGDLAEQIETDRRLTAALIGQFAVRRLTEDDSMSADELAGFVVSLVLDGVRN